MKSIKLDSFDVKAIVTKKVAKKRNVVMEFVLMTLMKAIHKFFKTDPIPRLSEAVVQRCSVKKVFLEISQSSQENNCARASFLMNFIKKETLAQVLFCEFCEISKNTFLHRAPQAAVSGLYQQHF